VQFSGKRISAMVPLRLCQFNVLAPSLRVCKPLDAIPWRERHTEICETLLELKPHLICLQEFDFATNTPGFAALYAEKLSASYELYLKKRTSSKPEGLALLVAKDTFDDIDVDFMDLAPGFCDRVAIFASMRHIASGQRLVIANTHLTVAHASNDHDIPMCRPKQMQQVLDRLEDLSGCDAVFICADMNSDHLETEPPNGPYTAEQVNRPVHMAFGQGFDSALHTCLPGIRPISHTCSYAQDGCADYIFYKLSKSLKLVSAFLHPERLAPDTPWSAESGWGSKVGATLSDHRPLLADFELQVSSPVVIPEEA